MEKPESGESTRGRKTPEPLLRERIAIVIGAGFLGVILFFMLDPTILGRRRTSGITEDLIRALDQAVRMYALDHGGRKPTTLEELAEPTFESETGYLESNTVPLDLWGNPFIYRPPTEPTGDDYEIISLGSDGVVGGERGAADIKLSELRDR